MIKALLLKTDGAHRQVDLPSEETYLAVRYLVAKGDGFDVVHDREKRIRGYIHDRGLLIGLPVNPVASLLFGINLVGDVLVTNPFNSDGLADGYDYDLDKKWFDEQTLLTFKSINEDESMIDVLEEDVSNMDLEHSVYSLTDNQMTEYMQTGAIPKDAKKVV